MKKTHLNTLIPKPVKQPDSFQTWFTHTTMELSDSAIQLSHWQNISMPLFPLGARNSGHKHQSDYKYDTRQLIRVSCVTITTHFPLDVCGREWCMLEKSWSRSSVSGTFCRSNLTLCCGWFWLDLGILGSLPLDLCVRNAQTREKTFHGQRTNTRSTYVSVMEQAHELCLVMSGFWAEPRGDESGSHKHACVASSNKDGLKHTFRTLATKCLAPRLLFVTCVEPNQKLFDFQEHLSLLQVSEISVAYSSSSTSDMSNFFCIVGQQKLFLCWQTRQLFTSDKVTLIHNWLPQVDLHSWKWLYRNTVQPTCWSSTSTQFFLPQCFKGNLVLLWP